MCSNCCEIPVENCPKHGKEYIEFKCKFCCSVAQWFCWYFMSYSGVIRTSVKAVIKSSVKGSM